MNFFDVIVAKEYESVQGGAREIKTAWNRVGRAWHSRSGDSLCFELYLIPNQRYVVVLKPLGSGKEKPAALPVSSDSEAES